MKLSESARVYIEKLAMDAGGGVFCLTLKKQGCNGFSFVPSLEKVIAPGFSIYEFDGVKIALDESYLDKLFDVEIDWVETPFFSKLSIESPKARGRCGCGMSVNF